jgi:putative PIN family toxin of toxin-antitoxin system
MLPLRLVLDTNVVAAALKPDSLPRTVLLLALTKPARLYVSTVILEEYQDVLARPELRIRKGIQRQILDLIGQRSYLVKPLRTLHVAADPGDNLFVECADAGRADYLVTGNQRHFPKFWKKTKIISSRELIDLVAPHLGS